MVGYVRDELLTLTMNDLLSAEDQAKSALHLDVLQKGKFVVSERNMIRRDGTLVPVEFSGKIMADGRIQEIVRDITQRKLAEENLERIEARARQSEKMEAVGNLAGGIAHDFNNYSWRWPNKPFLSSATASSA